MSFNTVIYNADYAPISIVPWPRAFDLVYFHKASVLEEYDQTFKTPSMERKIPKKIVLKDYVNLHKRAANPRYSKWNVFARDNYECAYCGSRVRPGEAQLEHIMPRSRGGISTWENTVTACPGCNSRKANRTPDEAGMPLRVRPFKPTHGKWMEILLAKHFAKEIYGE